MLESVRQRYTFEEYLELEAVSPVKHEFLEGHVWAMAGGSPAHAAIAVNLASTLREQLRGKPCRVFSSDLRVRVASSGLGTYPDVSVVCGELEADPADPRGHTVLNPSLLVEVLSPSTEEYDRGEKLAQFKTIASLQEILLVAHDTRRIEVWRREGALWTLEVARDEETATLSRLGCVLPLAEVYEDWVSASG